MTQRERLSATVEAELLAAGRAAVAEGRAESVSAWVNDALRLKADHDRRLRALDDFLVSYEAEHGVITDDEIRQATRRARAGAVVVRARP
jgi:Arc/MetJ-type ribon-helix-helix transcriptional regulator